MKVDNLNAQLNPMTCDTNDIDHIDTDGTDIVNEFLSALPRSNRQHVESANSRPSLRRGSASVNIVYDEGMAFSSHVIADLLREGWVVSNYHRVNDGAQNKFTFSKFNVETREVERTITETETVAELCR